MEMIPAIEWNHITMWAESKYKNIFDEVYNIHPLAVRVCSSSRSMINEVRNLLGSFTDLKVFNLDPVDIALYHVSDFDGIPLNITNSCRLVSECEIIPRFRVRVQLDDEGSLFLYIGGKALIAITGDRNKGVGFVCEHVYDAPPLLVTTYVLLPILSELLKKHSCYLIHGGCVAYDDRGIIIAGPSRCGKTTLTISMLSGGQCSFLSDDTCILDDESKPARIFSFPKKTSIRTNSIHLLSDALSQEALKICWNSRGKKVDIKEIVNAPLAESCQPAVLAFPKITGKKNHGIRRLSPLSALERLLPESLALIDPRTSERHFDALKKLTEDVYSCEIEMGTDLSTLPQLITGLVEGLAK